MWPFRKKARWSGVPRSEAEIPMPTVIVEETFTLTQKVPTEEPAWILSGDQLTIVMDGQTYSIGPSHANHAEILQAVKDKDWDNLPTLLDIPKAVESYTEGNVAVNEFGEVTYKNEPIHNSVAERIAEFFKQGLDYQPLVRFLERLMANPSKRAVEELYRFLENQGMPITPDGCFIGYKGVNQEFKDCHTNTFDNKPGVVHEMPRNLVDDDARRDCSNGFHVGSHQYATNFGSNTVLVKVDPADAVAVPYADAQKLRVCRYEVIAVSDKSMLEGPLFSEELTVESLQEALDDDDLVELYDEEDEY